MALRPIVGGFELIVGLRIAIHLVEAKWFRRLSISGARIMVRPNDGEPQVSARPEMPSRSGPRPEGRQESHDLYK